jgi:glycosyltransferase involved in cell wall biosynthesis
MKINNVKLTVALCTYNRANYLKHAVQSILEQSFKNYELLIMDNHSTDDTTNVINSFADERIKHIRHSKNIGGVENANVAINLAAGEYIIITHDDDMMGEYLLAKEIDVLDSDPSVLLVSSNCYLMNESNDVYDVALSIKKNIIYRKGDYLKAFLKGENYIMTPTVMLRTKFLKDNNIGFNKSAGPASDVLMWSAINCHTGKFIIVKDPLYKYRKHYNQDSKIAGPMMLYQLIPEMEKCVSSIGSISSKIERSLLIQIIKNIAQCVNDKDTYYKNLNKIVEMERYKNKSDLLLFIKILYLFPGPLKIYLVLKRKIFRVK